MNGRFLTRPTVGVDRVALQLISALAGRPDVGRLVLLHPPGELRQFEWLDRLAATARAKIEFRSVGRGTGHRWEQVHLCRAEAGLPLLSLCGTGPIGRRRQAVMLHDAQVWDVPSSYSLPFRLAYRSLLPALARSAHRVFTVSRFARSRLELHGIAPRGKVAVLPNGADHMLGIRADGTTLERHGLLGQPYILALGSLAPHKNLDLLIEAVGTRVAGGPELVVAGNGNSRVFSSVRLGNARASAFWGG